MSIRTSTSDTLIVTMAEDAYLGDAQFIIAVDGVQVGGIQTVTALHGSGQTQAFTATGNFGSGPHTVAVTFLNDAYGGSAARDRNLYFLSATLDGTAVAVNADVGGTTAATVAAANPPVATNTLTVNVSEDAWNGNAEFKVFIDGVQVGGTQTSTALHSAAASQNITLTGDFGSGPHNVVVQFINDAYGGSATTDRNLYVNSVNYDGTETAVNAELGRNGGTDPTTVADVATVSRGQWSIRRTRSRCIWPKTLTRAMRNSRC